MATIKIVSPKHGEHIVLIDDADFELVNKRRWHVCKFKHSKTFYACSSYTEDGKQKTLYMHRLIMGNHKEIDHLDGNGLNNQRSNLLATNHRVNVLNRGIQKNNTTGYKGVYRGYVRADGKQMYVATTRVNRKMIFGGYFDCPHKAALAYNELAKKYHGDNPIYFNKIIDNG